MIYPRRCFCFVFFYFLALTWPVFAAESLSQTIDYLIDHVAKSDATFVRNGTEYSPNKAADHIRAKYAHFKGDIHTPEDFIRLCASKSLSSGKPYLVRTRDGKQMQLDEWLTAALQAHLSSNR